ncbi:efflux RND transporter periplasmic adaptor subunit [Paraferrimonas sedimenticola]|uniref:Acriflavin resistance protein n=1 Tax=Paraferrimonas sedimenticola TaxID=375674 RepID=A0AA37VZU3_9GAMM|nr:HlyD family secretion protein [Paraferrimonas sedimenticola]GLP97796.1 acriflavin resistance protein [Paraferrimonas sedimenticola]
MNQKRFVLPGIGIGLLLLIIAILLNRPPSNQPAFDSRRLVEVTPLTQQMSAPEVIGYGRVAPKYQWQAMAEVSGRLVEKHPQLEPGRLLEKGTVLAQVDPLEYQLKLAQAQANLNATKVNLQKLNLEEENLKETLDIETQKLKLVDQEFQRRRNLNKNNLISNSEVELQKQSLLAQQKLIADMQNQLDLMPDERKVAEAQFQVDQAKLEDAQRQLDKTRIVLPFDARIGEVNIELDQVVSQGSTMISAQRLGLVEVKAELSLSDLRTLISSMDDFSSQGSLPSFESLALAGELRMQSSGETFVWPAKVTRVADNVSPDQATIGVYLEVEQDLRHMQLLAKPPLTKGMFLSAHIKGRSQPQYLIPERALHGESIYLMDAQQQLVIKPVDVLYRSPEGVAIRGEINQGDLLVLNDLVPAIAGMSLRTQAEENQ